MKDKVAEGWVRLYLAIRDAGGPDDEWERYWVDRHEMRKIWCLLDDTVSGSARAN